MSRAENHDEGRRAGLALAQPLLAGLLFVASLTPCPLLAQADKAKAPPPANRCLLVVETSRSMQRRSDAVLQTVQEMLKSGLAGQLRRGDTLGVWTYNESLYAGRFPLQTWSPEAQKDIALRVAAFLKGQKYEKRASLDKVLPALKQLIRDSPLITVILISSAEEKMHGTPFDGPINEFYQKWQNDQQKARMPFVTVLRAQDGQLGDFTVNTPPFAVQMPRLPQERQLAERIQSKLLEAVRSNSPPTAPPLIVSGKKAQPQDAPAPKPEPVAVNVQAPAPAPEATSTNESLNVKPPAPAPPLAQIAKVEAAPVMPAKASVGLSPEPSPAPMPVTEPKAEIVRRPEPSPGAPAPSKVAAAPALPTPAPEPAPAPPAAREVSPGTSANPTSVASAAPRSPSLALRPSSLPVPPAQVATAVPAETLVRNRSIWIAGLVLAGVAISFAVLLLRRSRAEPKISLITRSFEREKKP